MRTLALIVMGLVVLALAMWLTKPAKRVTTAWWFSAAWLLVTLWNLDTGMSHGYTLQEELPLQIAIFVIPVLGAWMVAWKGRGR